MNNLFETTTPPPTFSSPYIDVRHQSPTYLLNSSNKQKDMQKIKKLLECLSVLVKQTDIDDLLKFEMEDANFNVKFKNCVTSLREYAPIAIFVNDHGDANKFFKLKNENIYFSPPGKMPNIMQRVIDGNPPGLSSWKIKLDKSGSEKITPPNEFISTIAPLFKTDVSSDALSDEAKFDHVSESMPSYAKNRPHSIFEFRHKIEIRDGMHFEFLKNFKKWIRIPIDNIDEFDDIKFCFRGQLSIAIYEGLFQYRRSQVVYFVADNSKLYVYDNKTRLLTHGVFNNLKQCWNLPKII